jgi:putative redox protein
MPTKVVWKGKRSFEGTTPSGNKVLMDSPIVSGGEESAASPMELVAIAVGGCTGVDIVSIMEKKRANLKRFEVEIETEKAETSPKVYTQISLHYKFFGKELKESDVIQAIELSLDKYCSVAKMIEKTAKISYTFEILEA